MIKKALRKLLASLLAATLIFGCLSAWAESAAEQEVDHTYGYDLDEVTVAVTTPLTGAFSTSLWGNASSDMDARMLLHGYDLVQWRTAEGVFAVDDTVVSGILVTEDETTGDRTYTLGLYGDLTYSDGTPITAWDYAFSFLLTMSPEAAAIGGNVKRPEYIVGYQDYISGNAQALAGIRVLADDQLAVTVSGAYLPFFYELALLDCVPYPISMIAPGVRVADDGEGVYLTNVGGGTAPVFTAELLRSTLLGADGYVSSPKVVSGPYVLESFADGTGTFLRNDRFKGDAQGNRPAIRRIVFKSLASDELIPALADGSVVLINKATGADVVSTGVALTAENPLFTVSNYTRSGLSFLSFNADRDAVGDVRVRQAIASLIDKDGLVAETVGNYGLRTEGYYGLGQWMYQLLTGTIAYPVEEPTDGSAQAQAAYEEELAAWTALTMDDVPAYAQDAEAAAALLDAAGWGLNEKGEAFVPGADSLRYRQADGGLEPLRLSVAYTKGSSIGPALEKHLQAPLAQAGIELQVEAVEWAQLLRQYYRSDAPQFDMLYLATNFDVLFDPASSFTVNEAGQHVWTTSGLADEALYSAAVEMRTTEPGDLLSYCQSWLAFQQRFAQQLPILPIYSNVYFDFYPRVLQDYDITSSISWAQAITNAKMAEYFEEAEEELGEDELIFGD